MKLFMTLIFSSVLLNAGLLGKEKEPMENKLIKNIYENDVVIAEIHCIEDLAFLRDSRGNTFTQMYGLNSKPMKCEDIKEEKKSKK